ncbi:coiled-coil and C2 domain-containing protein 1-like isoform X2 [Patella vulgata]|uniref:coiled-coil and C2 domain-containing protein 1-like isoform X2 n=1 Tax=Patella vulgata TaxID=6465 RepID=UPI00217F41F4|nr:coiled-coil and C2 domain-containing protein 1-like isoform X2 [Patella vulgata]
MSGRKGEDRSKRKGASLMNQMGMGGMDDMYGMDGDDDFEAELAELMGEERPKKDAPKRKAEGVNLDMINKLAAENMKSFDSDEEMSDTEDPELLAELADLAGSSSPEKSPEKEVKKPMIPPPVQPRSQPSQPAPSQTQIFMPTTSGTPNQATGGPTASPSVSQTSTIDKQTHRMLTSRRDQYKQAALQAKHNNDIKTASQYVRISKQFDNVIIALEEGKEIDLSQMPPSPPPISSSTTIQADVLSRVQPPVSQVERSSMQATGDKTPELELPTTTHEEEKDLFKAPEEPTTVMEALEQRLAKYKTAEEQAKTANESGKARRMGRIVKQYQDAIKCHKAGKPVDYEELPTPPGFGPIPVGAPSPAPSPKKQQAISSGGGAVGGIPKSPSTGAVGGAVASSSAPVVSPQNAKAASLRPSPQPRAPPAMAASPNSSSTSVHGGKSPGQHPNRGESVRKGHSKSDQQLAFLKERSEEFKVCALNAKKNNDLELAKKYIRIMKGLEPMILAAESGLPVDLSQVPKSPNMPDDEDKFVIVSEEDCVPTGDRTEVYQKLEADLVQQIRICVTNSQHYTKLGDVPAASKFQKLEQNCRKDLDALKNAFRHGDPVPRFHYETKSFSMVQSNSDLGDNDLELVIVRGIQYNLPADYEEKKFDTYVTYDFPFPTEEGQKGQSSTVKGSINPEYEENFKISIARKSRSFIRVVERKSIKLDVFYKRGFFKSEKLLGSINVKLQPFESNCVIHDSYDLMDGRKSVGGKLEIKMRIRDPMKSKQVEEVKEKWLVIDQFMRTAASKPPKPKNEGTSCIDVLKFEKQQLDKQISALKDSLTELQTQTLKHKSCLIQEKIELQEKHIREGGAPALKSYLIAIQSEIPAFVQEAQQLTKVGEIQKAQTILTKKKLAEKEFAAYRSKYPNL